MLVSVWEGRQRARYWPRPDYQTRTQYRDLSAAAKAAEVPTLRPYSRCWSMSEGPTEGILSGGPGYRVRSDREDSQARLPLLVPSPVQYWASLYTQPGTVLG